MSILALACAMLLAGCGLEGTSAGPPGGSTPETLASRSRESYSGARVEAIEWGECFFASLFVDASRSEWSGSGRPASSTSAYVSYAAYDPCTGTVLRNVHGWSEIAAGDFSTSGNGQSAALSTTIEVYDDAAAGMAPARLEVSWTADGSATRTKNRTEYDDGTTKSRRRSDDTVQPALATGTLQVGSGPIQPIGGRGIVFSGRLSTMTQQSNRPVAPEIVYFDAWQHEIIEGSTAGLSWWVTGTDPIVLSIDGGVGDVTGSTVAMVTPTETTTYRLTATNTRGTATAELTIVVLPPPEPDAFEPNDDPASATPIALDYVSPPLTIHPGDVDWFQFTLSERAIVRADAIANVEGSTLDPILGLFRADGTPLEVVDDTFGLDPRVETVLDPGTYLLAVTGYDDFDFVGVHTRSGHFRLEVSTIDAPADDEFEPNDALGAATPIVIPAWFHATLGLGDVDWYRFDLTEPTTLVANVHTGWIGSTLHPMLVLLNSGEAVVATDDDPWGAQLEVDLVPGTYYLVVTGPEDADFVGDHLEVGRYALDVFGW